MASGTGRDPERPQLRAEVVTLVHPEQHSLHAHLPRGLYVGVKIVHEDALAGRKTEPLGGQSIDAGLGLGHPHLGGAHDVIEEVMDADLALETPAQREIGVAEDTELVGGPKLPDELEIGLDGVLGQSPFFVERGERPARPLLERLVGRFEPGLAVAATALDGSPRLVPIQRLEDGGARQAVRSVEVARDVPAHVPEHAAEVEDYAAQTSTCAWPCPCLSSDPDSDGAA